MARSLRLPLNSVSKLKMFCEYSFLWQWLQLSFSSSMMVITMCSVIYSSSDEFTSIFVPFKRCHGACCRLERSVDRSNRLSASNSGSYWVFIIVPVLKNPVESIREYKRGKLCFGFILKGFPLLCDFASIIISYQ
jgi:hypothetical protein